MQENQVRRRKGKATVQHKSFTYRELGDSECRVLKILATDLNQSDIQCELHYLPLHSETDFDALSYVWGDSGSTRTILVNGLPFQVTLNLFQALDQFRRLTARLGRFVWIDAICINQADNGEKSRQVPRMTDIYSNAVSILVWLGPNTSEFDSRVKNLFQWMNLLESNQSKSTEDNVNISAALQESKEDILEAVIYLNDKPWFSRVWVIQEVCLAKADPIIYAGPYHTTLARYENMYHVLLDLGYEKTSRGDEVDPDPNVIHLTSIRLSVEGERLKQLLIAFRQCLFEYRLTRSGDQSHLNLLAGQVDRKLHDILEDSRVQCTPDKKQVLTQFTGEHQHLSCHEFQRGDRRQDSPDTFTALLQESSTLLDAYLLQLASAKFTQGIRQSGAGFFVELLVEYADRDSSVTHDKIYGLLGLAQVKKSNPLSHALAIDPDYRLPFPNVCHQYASMLLVDTADLRLIICRRRNLAGVPSWVPDFRYLVKESETVVDEQSEVSLSVDQKILSVTGSIMGICDAFLEPLLSINMAQQSTVSRRIDWLEQHIIKPSARLRKIDPATIRDQLIEVGLVDYFGNTVEFWREAYLSAKNGTLDLADTTTVDCIAMLLARPQLMLEDGRTVLLLNRLVAPRRGDRVCILKGLYYPILIRPLRGAPGYRLLGCCQGVSDWENEKSARDEIFTLARPRTIVLH